ncbi:MAG TPA: BrnT family toxin [Pyrinomonadaceae bacterium]|nr:BrnT family toxin [Pyrinomonadaceae bacterium]
MEFEWDEAKRRSNLRKHGIDFVGIEELFEGMTVTILDDRTDYGEERFVTFGLLDGRVVAVAHTETEEVIRIVSVRKATKNEESGYFKEIAD